MSMPVQLLNKTKPPITEAYFRASASFSWAIAAVDPMKGVIEAKNLREEGSRPSDAAEARIFAIFGRRSAGEWLATKMASA